MNRKYRKTIIAGNWKMNLLASDVKSYAEKLKASAGKVKYCDVAVCVPYVMIPAAIRAFRDTRISVGAQDVSEYDSGAYTGCVSAAQLKDVGVKYVVIGHSECRAYRGDCDSTVNRKVTAAIKAGLLPIVCVGETQEQREMGLSKDVIRTQVKSAFFGVSADRARKVTVAYEPIWAIGTGNTATPEQAEEICQEIRATVRGLYDARISRAVTVQYGGSMNPANAAGLLAQPDIDGGLIGGASLDADKFFEVISAANQ